MSHKLSELPTNDAVGERQPGRGYSVRAFGHR